MTSDKNQNSLNSLSALERKVVDELPKKPSIIVDYDYYAHFLDGADAPEEYKRELVQTIWSIMFQCASLGFDLHPLQQVEGVCGQFEEKSKIPVTDSRELVDCS